MTTQAAARVLAAFAMAVFVYGLTFGVLSRTAGFSVPQATVMSALVFAGAAQFSAVAALSAGASSWLAVTTAISINLRLLPLALATSDALSPRARIRALQCLAITDESVAIASREDGSVDATRLVQSGVVVAASWITGTAMGAIGATIIDDPGRLGLDAAFAAGFMALLAPRLREDSQAAAATLLGAAIALTLVPITPVGVPVVVASSAALLGLRR